MPKIMFRPAPTPPPFVPPTPTYDTTVYAKSNPFPIQAGSLFTIKFLPANVPNFTIAKICVDSEPLEHMDVLVEISMTNEDFNKEISAEALYDSDAEPYLSVVFCVGGTPVHEANLILSQL